MGSVGRAGRYWIHRYPLTHGGSNVATAEHIRVLVADDEETRQIETDPVRQALAVALVSFAEQIGATVVAEGVESELELEALRRAGIRHAQGFLLSRPGPLAEVASGRCLEASSL
jgi:EAL domain-containing protein (putative c-di-GMP-specific phosphodiesterase class I)